MKVIFLDRDGVINKYPGDGKYVSQWREFKFIAGSIEAIRKLKAKGFKLFVISNQAGVSKGLYSQKDLDGMTLSMKKELKKHAASLDGVYYCTHQSEENCACKKPKTGLLVKALEEAKIKPEVCLFVGDSFVDMQTAKNFGAKPILVLSGQEKIANRNKWPFQPEYICDSLLIATHYICEHYG